MVYHGYSLRNPVYTKFKKKVSSEMSKGTLSCNSVFHIPFRKHLEFKYWEDFEVEMTFKSLCSATIMKMFIPSSLHYFVNVNSNSNKKLST